MCLEKFQKDEDNKSLLSGMTRSNFDSKLIKLYHIHVYVWLTILLHKLRDIFQIKNKIIKNGETQLLTF